VSHHASAFVNSAGKPRLAHTATGLRAGLLWLVLPVLMGCTDPSKPKLEVACALTKCICLSNADNYFVRNFGDQTATAVLWTDMGNAYCPENFSLRQINEKKEGYQYYTP
jgi:hypothetical protein